MMILVPNRATIDHSNNSNDVDKNGANDDDKNHDLCLYNNRPQQHLGTFPEATSSLTLSQKQLSLPAPAPTKLLQATCPPMPRHHKAVGSVVIKSPTEPVPILLVTSTTVSTSSDTQDYHHHYLQKRQQIRRVDHNDNDNDDDGDCYRGCCDEVKNNVEIGWTGNATLVPPKQSNTVDASASTSPSAAVTMGENENINNTNKHYDDTTNNNVEIPKSVPEWITCYDPVIDPLQNLIHQKFQLLWSGICCDGNIVAESFLFPPLSPSIAERNNDTTTTNVTTNSNPSSTCSTIGSMSATSGSTSNKYNDNNKHRNKNNMNRATLFLRRQRNNGCEEECTTSSPFDCNTNHWHHDEDRLSNPQQQEEENQHHGTSLNHGSVSRTTTPTPECVRTLPTPGGKEVIIKNKTIITTTAAAAAAATTRSKLMMLVSHSTLMKIRSMVLSSLQVLQKTKLQKHQGTEKETEKVDMLLVPTTYDIGWNFLTWTIKCTRTVHCVKFHVYERIPFPLGTKVIVVTVEDDNEIVEDVEEVQLQMQDGNDTTNTASFQHCVKKEQKRRNGTVIDYIENKDLYLIQLRLQEDDDDDLNGTENEDDDTSKANKITTNVIRPTRKTLLRSNTTKSSVRTTSMTNPTKNSKMNTKMNQIKQTKFKLKLFKATNVFAIGNNIRCDDYCTHSASGSENVQPQQQYHLDDSCTKIDRVGSCGNDSDGGGLIRVWTYAVLYGIEQHRPHPSDELRVPESSTTIDSTCSTTVPAPVSIDASNAAARMIACCYIENILSIAHRTKIMTKSIHSISLSLNSAACTKSSESSSYVGAALSIRKDTLPKSHQTQDANFNPILQSNLDTYNEQETWHTILTDTMIGDPTTTATTTTTTATNSNSDSENGEDTNFNVDDVSNYFEYSNYYSARNQKLSSTPTKIL